MAFSRQTAGVVAVDGKTLRRSFDAASEKSALHMVSAWSCEERLVLAQIATDEKSNEITAVPQLLRLLNLKGRTVTTDAMNCQRDIAEQIVDQGGDYVLSLKRNQPTLFDDVARYFADSEARAPASRRSRPIMAASRPEAPSFATMSIGCRTSIAGPA